MRLARNIITIIYTLLAAILLIGLYEWIYTEHYAELDFRTIAGIIGLSVVLLIPSIIAWFWHYKIGIIQGTKKYLVGTGYALSLVIGLFIICVMSYFITIESMKDAMSKSSDPEKLNEASFDVGP